MQQQCRLQQVRQLKVSFLNVSIFCRVTEVPECSIYNFLSQIVIAKTIVNLASEKSETMYYERNLCVGNIFQWFCEIKRHVKAYISCYAGFCNATFAGFVNPVYQLFQWPIAEKCQSVMLLFVRGKMLCFCLKCWNAPSDSYSIFLMLYSGHLHLKMSKTVLLSMIVAYFSCYKQSEIATNSCDFTISFKWQQAILL